VPTGLRHPEHATHVPDSNAHVLIKPASSRRSHQQPRGSRGLHPDQRSRCAQKRCRTQRERYGRNCQCV